MDRMKYCFLVLAGLGATISGWAAHSSFAPPQAAPMGVHAAVTGAAVFHEKGCEHCHGADLAGVTDKGPSLLNVGKQFRKDAIEKQIREGGREMPAFGDSMQTDEVTALVEMLAKRKAPKKHSGG
jgi:mono/diheme cytochrome c family protein